MFSGQCSPEDFHPSPENYSHMLCPYHISVLRQKFMLSSLDAVAFKLEDSGLNVIVSCCRLAKQIVDAV